MTDLKVLTLVGISTFALFGCNTTNNGENMISGLPTLSEKKSDKQQLKISELFTSFFNDIFKNEEEKLISFTTKTLETDEVNETPIFKKFNRVNTINNIKVSLDNNPKIDANIGKLKTFEADMALIESTKALTSDIQAIGGLQAEDRDTEPAATVILSTRKLLYDANSADLSLESKNLQMRSGQIAVHIAADLAALDALKAWIDLVRFKSVNKIFTEKFEKTQPLLEQIESISASGLADKKSLLAAQRQILELQDRFSGSQSMEQISEQVFLDSFPGANLASVVEKPMLKINETDLFNGLDLTVVPSIREKILLLDALNIKIKGLEASEKPRVAFNASVNAPLKDTLDDGTANAGLNLTYDFNDGGTLDAQIDQVKAELEILNSEIKALKKALKVEYEKQVINYKTSRDRLEAIDPLIEVSKEIIETARQQLLSGRSTIKDILDAEVSLSSLRIEKINAEADTRIALLTIKTYKDGLTQLIGWSY